MDILMHYGIKHKGKIFKIYVITSKGKIKNYHFLLPNATGRLRKIRLGVKSFSCLRLYIYYDILGILVTE